MWCAQFDVLLQGAKEPKNQMEIVAACRADDWLGLVLLARRAGAANYFYLCHTRHKVHMFCTWEMICFYDMVFCDARPSEVMDSLRLAPRYMALNKDPRVWAILGELIEINHDDAIIQASPHVQFAGLQVSPREKYLLLSRQFERLREKKPLHEVMTWRYGVAAWDAYNPPMSEMMMNLCWAEFIRMGEFDYASMIKSAYPLSNVAGYRSLATMLIENTGYLEGIDYLLANGFETVRPDMLENKWTYARVNGTVLPEGSRGKEDLIRRSAKTKNPMPGLDWVGLRRPARMV
jgi:hypothetical protein